MMPGGVLPDYSMEAVVVMAVTTSGVLVPSMSRLTSFFFLRFTVSTRCISVECGWYAGGGKRRGVYP